jgi:hypothetical protein
MAKGIDESIGEALKEIGVLLCVFGILDPLFLVEKASNVTLLTATGCLVVGLILLSAGVYLEIVE